MLLSVRIFNTGAGDRQRITKVGLCYDVFLYLIVDFN